MNATATTIETAEVVHPFQARGLGLAPFRFTGLSIQDVGEDGLVKIGSIAVCEVRTTPGGTCAFCGMYITEFYNIISADRKPFHVGSECVKKTEDAKLIKPAKIVANKVRKAKTDARNKAKIAAARLAIATDATRERLAGLPHPMPTRAADGQTLLMYCEWMLENSGTAGRLKVAKIIAG